MAKIRHEKIAEIMVSEFKSNILWAYTETSGQREFTHFNKFVTYFDLLSIFEVTIIHWKKINVLPLPIVRSEPVNGLLTKRDFQAWSCKHNSLIFLLPQASGCLCLDFGCTHPIDGLF